MVTFGFLNISFDHCLRCSRLPAPQGNVSHRCAYDQDRLRSHRPTHSSPSALVCYLGNRPHHDGERAEYIALMSTTDRPVGLVVENAQRWMTPCCRCLGPLLALVHRLAGGQSYVSSVQVLWTSILPAIFLAHLTRRGSKRSGVRACWRRWDGSAQCYMCWQHPTCAARALAQEWASGRSSHPPART